jgi:hypothetical protein
MTRMSTDLAARALVHGCRKIWCFVGLRRHLVSRLAAVSLLTLILLPFTAPFATYQPASSSTHSLDGIPKEKTGSDDKLIVPSQALLFLTVRVLVTASADLESQLQAHPQQQTVLRI